MVRPHIHFAVTLTLNLWQQFPHFSPRKRDLFPNSITNLELGGVSIGYVIATSEPADSQVSTSSLLTFTKDRSRYLLTFTKDKYHLPWAWWRLNRLCHCDLWTSRQPSLNFELVDIYKRQVSTSSLLTFTKDRSRYLLTFTKDKYHLPWAWWRLNRLCYCDLWTSRQPSLNFELVDIYKRQVSTSSLLTFTKDRSRYLLTFTKDKSQFWALLTSKKDRSRYLLTFTKDKYHLFRAWWRLNRLCHCDLWTSRQLSLNFEPCWHLQKTGLTDTRWHL